MSNRIKGWLAALGLSILLWLVIIAVIIEIVMTLR